MRAAFNLFDKDNSGTIDPSEIAGIYGHNGTESQEVWQAIIQEIDINGDGQISFDEFKIMFKKLAERDESRE